MGFADYLSRKTTAEAAPRSDKDKNFVINTIEENKHALLRNNIAPHGANNANKRYNDVINTSHTSTNKTTAFRPSQRSIQSLCSLHNFNSQNKKIISNIKLVAITTRVNPSKETFKVPIKKRYRAPNRKQTIHMDQPTPNNLNSVATQTEPTSIKGKGLDPLDLTRHEALFATYDGTPTPLYRENLNLVFNEIESY